MRMMRKIHWRALAFLGMICLLFSGNFALGRDVELEELSISLYSKPVTGFRLVLDRSERFVSNQIIAHVGAEDPTPAFQYQRSIIFENIRYNPISEDKEISLYFLLKSLQGQYTELTLVAMYDYRQSISSREFPALAHNLKIDLARLVRKTTGDIMRSGDILYDDAMLAKMKAIPDPIEDSANDQPKVAHYKEEEVDNASVLILNDPFKTDSEKSPEARSQNSDDSTIVRLKQRIEALQKREKDLLATERTLRNDQANMQRQQEILLAKVKNNRALRDSVVMLNQRVEALLGQNYLSDDVSVSSETAHELALLEKENKRLIRTQASLDSENDSLRKVVKVYGEQLGRLASGGKTTAEEMSRISEENKTLQSELQAYKAREALASEGASAETADSLLQVLAEANIKNASLKQDLERITRDNGRLSEDNDFLSGKKMQLEERIVSLDAENRSLRDGTALINTPPDNHQVDSLNAAIRTERRIAASIKSELTKVKKDLATTKAESERNAADLINAQQTRKDLESRIAQLEAQGNVTPTPVAKVKADVSNSALRDSVLLLKQQLSLADNRIYELSRGQQALSDAQEQLQIKDLSLRKLKVEYESINNQLYDNQKRNESLQASLNSTRKQLNDYQKARTGSKQEANLLQQQLNSLQAEHKSQEELLNHAIAENAALNDSLHANNIAKSNLRNEIKNREKRLSKQAAQQDSLKIRLAKVRIQESGHRKTIASLEARIDSLSQQQMPAGDQQKFIRDQWAKLQKWEKDLDARDQTTQDREKLLKQREQVYNKNDAELAAREERVKGLEAKEARLNLLEQQLKASEGVESVETARQNVREGRVVEFGTQVAVFITESPLSPKNVQKQVITYMLSRDELYDDQFPDLVYRNTQLAEVDTEPVEMKIRIDSKGSGSILQISFKLTTGEYLGIENYRERIEPSKQLIAKMLRYKH